MITQSDSTDWRMKTVQPVIDYCITLWTYAPSTQVNKVQRFQNRAARNVSGVQYWDISGLSIVNASGG